MKSKLHSFQRFSPRFIQSALFALLFATSSYAQPLVEEQVTSPTPFAQENRPSTSMDPFLAGSLGLIPYVSGFYVGPQPGQGLVFTLVDVALSFGFYSAKHTKNGNPENARYFLWAMGANNIVDAVVSTRAAMARQQKTASTLHFLPQGGVQYVFYAAF